jgi:hypothetical protein
MQHVPAIVAKMKIQSTTLVAPTGSYIQSIKDTTRYHHLPPLRKHHFVSRHCRHKHHHTEFLVEGPILAVNFHRKSNIELLHQKVHISNIVRCRMHCRPRSIHLLASLSVQLLLMAKTYFRLPCRCCQC